MTTDPTLPTEPMPKELAADDLCRGCDDSSLDFDTTDELQDVPEIIGQKRAIDAVRFGMGMRARGYNFFALGPLGTGKHSVIQRFLTQQAPSQPTPPDICYVENFEDPMRPKLLLLPPGRGRQLRADMERFTDDLRSAIPAAFDSDEYRSRKTEIEKEVKKRNEAAVEAVKKEATENGFSTVPTPNGVMFVPIADDEPLSQERFQKLPDEERSRIESVMAVLQQQLSEITQQVPRWEKEAREKLRSLNRGVADLAVGHLVDELRTKHREDLDIVRHLDAVQQDVIENVDQIIAAHDANPVRPEFATQVQPPKTHPFEKRYQINLLVDQSGQQGAPVVYEDDPSYPNLLGQIEYQTTLGALVTDFSLIRAGALHRANGGYLILDAMKLLTQSYSWEGLKRALRASQLRFDSVGRMMGVISTVSLEPEATPVNVKVILLGDRNLYYTLSQVDPEFHELFKVAVDFEDDMERTDDNVRLYARMIATIVRRERLLPFDRSGVQRVIEQSARMAADSEKLSTHLRTLVDLIREADYWAKTRTDARTVTSADVQTALDAQIERLDRVRDRMQEEICKGTILIDTDGEKAGQINGLSVIQIGQLTFGRPTRITATVRFGEGELVDIEREVALGGPLHSKGVYILSGYLGAHYAPEHPLSLAASLVFEQSYGLVDGDSASLAELVALLTAIAETPVRQSLAVTGSVNQQGFVQAIGGVNDKIEGFFELCAARGLTGQQGVVIPHSNVRHLMLAGKVVDAVKGGKFHVWSVRTVSEAIEILTGLPAGVRDATGRYPAGSFNARVEQRLIAFSEKRRQLGVTLVQPSPATAPSISPQAPVAGSAKRSSS
ncbi:MAG: ATP-binding protein [Thermoanaerobaculia bacterium]